ncbi:molybdate transport system ATP-binding protein [Novosphingobium sp. SG751A]|uniref:molybdenum ABC transporter ATP-binding protein n=1 Tax=Novosphingobium sp. SG751A TaxID=2587000 RepID=UPI0015575692|nr:ATP-binding cassette domain-containing protein [Novosphingobium sp. SG751A]NOW44388.1 molybdate transport system ATP-binding protein [Novosphingobium sp. SG751A]
MSFEVDVSITRGSRRIAAGFATGPGITALFGRSGAGKTSVLDMIAGLARPDEGRIAVGGRVLFDAEAGIDLRPEVRGCGYVFQDYRLFPHMSVEGNLRYGWRMAAPDARWIAFEQVVEFLGLGGLLTARPRRLSGGEAQRVAIGRALLSGARFLLMDEPLSSLDADRREEIMRVIERIRDELALPILYVSHDRREVERLAGQIVEMD